MLKYTLFLIIATEVCAKLDEKIECDRRPLGAKTYPLPSDNRFALKISGLENEYIPDKEYPITLYSRDNISTFIAFTISAREDEILNGKNGRPLHLHPGRIFPSRYSDEGMISPNCNNTVIQANINPKYHVEASWRAPPKDNKCVTIYALVAVKYDVWYDYDGPLSKRVCEDRRKAADMPPIINDDNCNVCEDAKFQLTFEGTWSFNTHEFMFPKTPGVARFSDIVGASHGNGFCLYKLNKMATEGLKMLAEQGNTTQLEQEVQQELGNKVRTIIKATEPPSPSMSTSAVFRAGPNHHRVSMVAAIIPSPDWFLGVADFELCSIETKYWAENLTLNLYPIDAGTDSGMDFESPNEGTMPPKPISLAVINREALKDDEKKKPFAKLHIKLLKTYSNPACKDYEEENEVPSYGGEDSTSRDYVTYTNYKDNFEPPHYTTSSEEPSMPDGAGDPECPVQWEKWLSCEGECREGVLRGYRSRLGNHVVDGVPVGKYANDGSGNNFKIPKECLDIPLITTEECEEPCNESSTTDPPFAPGEKWL